MDKLFGFRSNTGWKKTLATAWYTLCIFGFIAGFFTSPEFPVGQYDLIISKITNILYLLMFILPPLFLSDFDFTKKVPLFKEKKTSKSIFAIAFFVLVMSTGISYVEAMHTNDYQKNIVKEQGKSLLEFSKLDNKNIPKDKSSNPPTNNEIDHEPEQKNEETEKKTNEKPNSTNNENNLVSHNNKMNVHYLEKTTTNMIQKISPIFAVNPLISKEI